MGGYNSAAETEPNGACHPADIAEVTNLVPPADTLRNNNVITTSKRSHFDVITSKWRRFDAMTTLLPRYVFGGLSCRCTSSKVGL